MKAVYIPNRFIDQAKGIVAANELKHRIGTRNANALVGAIAEAIGRALVEGATHGLGDDEMMNVFEWHVQEEPS